MIKAAERQQQQQNAAHTTTLQQQALLKFERRRMVMTMLALLSCVAQHTLYQEEEVQMRREKIGKETRISKRWTLSQRLYTWFHLRLRGLCIFGLR